MSANAQDAPVVVARGAGLGELPLRPEYRSDGDDLLRDFYLPCLGCSSLYRRAVGYFTSRGLAVAAQGVTSMIDRGGRMLLVASPLFDADDLEAIRRGYEAREEIVARALIRQLNSSPSEAAIEDRLSYLAWLVAHDRLEIRVAVPTSGDGHVRTGIYHEKLGLFSDERDNVVAFTGSPNETAGGLVDNFESIDVFWSWDDPQERVPRKVANFERLWENRTAGLDVVAFPEAVQRALLKFRPSHAQPPQPLATQANTLWQHQSDALSIFLKRERGVLEMATGTGKTRTALQICHTLLRNKVVDCVLVTADGNDLLDQWHRELLGLARDIGPARRIWRHYGDRHERDYFNLDPVGSLLLVSRFALPPALRALSAQSASRTILIHDEVHRLGSPGNRNSLAGLSDAIRFRLGLSATPEREYDKDGTIFIEQHIGPVCYRFELSDAIRSGILSPFDYFPIEYVPNDNDKERIAQVYKRAAARKHAGQPMPREEIWTALALVHKTSRAKLPLFESFILQHPALLERCIIFVETQEYGEEVLKIVHRLRHDFHTYFSGEDSTILRRFARGDLECLLTCHRLSEGIDIQSLRSVILFSSARARLETIQRMGRCLRADPRDRSKRANIVDFIRVADVSGVPDDDNADQCRRDWLDELAMIRLEEAS